MASTFSYAQAAKGIATPASASKPAPSSAPPAKDATNTPGPGSLASVKSWADENQTEPSLDRSTPTRESRSQRSSSKPARSDSRSVDASSISSPDMGASSSSTVTKDDDVSSIPNTSSESTWDNKSQASTSVEKSVEGTEKTSDKAKNDKNAVMKPLQEAPLPAVNVWKLRADEQKAKVHKAPTPAATNGVASGLTGSSMKRNDSATQEKAAASEKSRTEAKEDIETKKGVKGRSSDKETKPVSSTLPPPPNRDREAWPTPEIAIGEDRKKAHGKSDKVEKERKDSAPAPTHGKHEWVKVPYTPSVVFNTPLPNAANARRGGRPGGRGGAQHGGRLAASSNNGVGNSERNDPASSVGHHNDQSKRERPAGVSPRDVSPRSKHADTTASLAGEGQVPPATGDSSVKPTNATVPEADTLPRRVSLSSHVPRQGGSYHPKAQHSARLNKNRRDDFSGSAEARRDGVASVSKEHVSDSHRISSATQTESMGDGDRRASAFSEHANGHHVKHGRYGSHTGGRDRGRGGRNARASYSNGHQFNNAHPPPMSVSSGFPMGPRSPTSFSSENGNFFAAPQGKYGRNGQRSQSMANDSYRFQPYQAGSPVPPLQTYNMFEYNSMQTMSAVPYSPYVDQFALFSMITTQVEYYFSVENLLKDIYLRRHMDSQGFVSLPFIAGFNRIKHLSTDLELIKLVCQQSKAIEYRTSEDGLDRLRCRDGWDRWVLEMAERDKTAQNEGPKELHRPPVPHPTGFDQSSFHQWSGFSAGTAAGVYGTDGSRTLTNGFHETVPTSIPEATENLTNGTAKVERNGVDAVNGHQTETSTA